MIKINLNELKERLNNEKCRSAWERGKVQYARELIEEYANDYEYISFETFKDFEKALLNGAYSWKIYSWGGSSLIYDEEICKRLATPSEQKRTKNGYLKPNKYEEWLDVQARAISQACYTLYRLAKYN